MSRMTDLEIPLDFSDPRVELSGSWVHPPSSNLNSNPRKKGLSVNEESLLLVVVVLLLLAVVVVYHCCGGSKYRR